MARQLFKEACSWGMDKDTKKTPQGSLMPEEGKAASRRGVILAGIGRLSSKEGMETDDNAPKLVNANINYK
jgi:hypothetical protein